VKIRNSAPNGALVVCVRVCGNLCRVFGVASRERISRNRAKADHQLCAVSRYVKIDQFFVQ
jgi:hypothetical protein